ncbi:hypothetical protein AUJ66_01690 [Candidatus Desantisbacteria bacterium CG1_02_38_46]|nr:MAG: hypothetical protein AUJ66_01690 [Candidatus Desantisbacteria bacterium CG1_02_38_46]
MDKELLLSGLAKFGYPLMETKTEVDPEQVLVGLVKSADSRLLEGFPVVLASILTDKKIKFNPVQIENKFKNSKGRNFFNQLLALSLAVFQHFNYKPELEKLHRFELIHQERLKDLRNKLVHNEDLKIDKTILSSERVKNTFMTYVVNSELHSKTSLKEKMELKDEFTREFFLSRLFSPKQKELITKKLSGQALTKTEKEYYSRTVKKKIMAIANSEIHRLAQKLLEF